MAYLVLALGAFLSIGGALSILSGYNIVEIERGWTAVIAGATALTGGIVTIALGLVIKVLLDLRSTLKDRAATVTQAVGMQEALEPAPGHELLVPEHGSTGPVAPDLLAPERLAPERLAPEILAPDLLAPERLIPTAPVDASAMVMTAELENSMLAAILATHDTEERGYEAAGRDTVDRNEARAPHIDALLDTQRRDDFASPSPLQLRPVTDGEVFDRDSRVGTTSEPLPVEAAVEKARFKVTFKKPSAPIVPETQNPVLPDADAPAMDDWLDRAFSALDSEGAKNTDLHRPGSYGPETDEGGSPEPTRQRQAPDADATRTNDDRASAAPLERELAYADGMAGRAEATFEAEPPDQGLSTAPVMAPVATSAVIGRYEADGTSYIMYADGSIEAHSETGVARFNSMAELKTFIESTG